MSAITKITQTADRSAIEGGQSPAPSQRTTIEVSFVLPCLNEARTLPECIDTAMEAARQLRALGLNSEIVIADNGSTDGSIELALEKGCRVVRVTRRGYGNALIQGLRAARGKYLVMGDADASYDFREAVAMIRELMNGSDLCMGNRFAGDIRRGAMPWINRYVGNPTLTGILNLFFRSGIGDAHCGLRAITKDAFDAMRLNSSGMEFASEMVVKASLLRMKTTESPVSLHPDGRDRRPHLRPWRDGWRHLKFLFMLSPFWLYVVPSLLLMLFSVCIFALLLATPPQQVFHVGPIWFGDHWMILAGGLCQLGCGGLVFGAAASISSVRQGYRRLTRPLRWVRQAATVEHAVFLGIFLCAVSAGVFACVLFRWGQTDFGPLREMRQMVVATTLLLIGVQAIFGGFLLAILGEDHEQASDAAIEEFPDPQRIADPTVGQDHTR
jgi:hypothetical protein